jgi:hypothetical protein
VPLAGFGRTRDHFSGVHPDLNLNGQASFGAVAIRVPPLFLLHPECGEKRPLLMVFKAMGAP